MRTDFGAWSSDLRSPKYRPVAHKASKSVNAFHEKAGLSQVDSSLASLNKVLFSRRVAAVAMFHPHFRGAIRFARCMLGVLVSAGAAICLAPCGSALGESNLGQAINAVTETRLWAFVFSLPGTVLEMACFCKSTFPNRGDRLPCLAHSPPGIAQHYLAAAIASLDQERAKLTRLKDLGNVDGALHIDAFASARSSWTRLPQSYATAVKKSKCRNSRFRFCGFSPSDPERSSLVRSCATESGPQTPSSISTTESTTPSRGCGKRSKTRLKHHAISRLFLVAAIVSLLRLMIVQRDRDRLQCCRWKISPTITSRNTLPTG